MPKATKDFITLPSVPPNHPDADIIRWSAELVTGSLESLELDEPGWSVVNYDAPPEVRARRAELTNQYRDLRHRLGHARAVTPDGIQAKARALLVQYAPGRDAVPPDDESDDFLGWSMCRDIVAGSAA